MSEDDGDEAAWPASAFAKQMQVGQDAVEKQMKAMNAFAGLGAPDALTGMAAFKARVQSGGRISLPEAERDTLDIDEGDVVQAFILPVDKDDDSENGE